MEKDKFKFELWWLLYGVVIAFFIQVTYDMFGEIFGQKMQITLGFSLAISLLVLLISYAFFKTGQLKKKAREAELLVARLEKVRKSKNDKT